MQTLKTRDPRRQFWVQSTKPELEGKLGTTFSLSNGTLGMRYAHPEMPSWARPEFYLAGSYAGGPAELLGFHDADHILSHPERITQDAKAQIGDASIWTLPNLPYPFAVDLRVGKVPFSFESEAVKILSCERLLDMAGGFVRRRLVYRDMQGRRTCVDSERFVSFSDPHLAALRYAVRPWDHEAPIAVVPVLHCGVTNTGGVRLWEGSPHQEEDGLCSIVCTTSASRHAVAIAQAASLEMRNREVVLTLVVAAIRGSRADALARVRTARDAGWEPLRKAHLEAYAETSAGALVDFDDNPATVQGFNFGQMHLQMAFGPQADEVGIPIKGYTGHGYRFLNFWDMDFHMFPYYLVTRPREARKLLEYRYGQLDQYRENARAWGASGAQVPWETATRGVEETAPWLCLQEREIHISADAAYMFKLYDELTPDRSAMTDMGAEFTFETARFYASRISWNEVHQRYELLDIGCPDQYHTFADNNVFISTFARWNLEQAIALSRKTFAQAGRQAAGVTDAELAHWQAILDNFHIIEPDERGLVEEFEGFFALSPDLDGVCETWCAHTQAVKQPDVLAACVAFEDRFPLSVRRANWHYYNARTLHGSSLSLPGMAYAAARCGLNDEGLYHLHKSARMDLDDVNLDTERGVHVSGAAVEWQAIVFGYGGLTPRREALCFRPNLPRQWRHLTFVVHWQFQRLVVDLRQSQIRFAADDHNEMDIRIRLGNAAPAVLRPGAVLNCPLLRQTEE